MALRPAARITANARYGLHAASTERNSTRVAFPFCGLYVGTRTRAERLLWPQHPDAGASPPAAAVRSAAPHRALVGVTHAVRSAVISPAGCRRPARHPPA